MGQRQRQTISFDGFTLDLTLGCVKRGDEEVSLRPKSFAVLQYLVENSGRLVSKAELMGVVWPDTAVTDDSLVQCLIEIRRALGDGTQQLIKTVPRRGYIFTMEATRHDSTAPQAVDEKQDDGAGLVIEGGEPANDDAPPAVASEQMAMPAANQPGRRAARVARPALLAACVVLVGLVAASYVWMSAGSESPGREAVRSIAVLPFKPIAPKDRDEYLGTGIADALIANLSNVTQIVVRPTSAVLRYGAEGQNAIAAGRELKVDAVLDGRLQKAGDRVRLTVQLISVRDGTPLWAGKFDEKLTDIFAVQDLISQSVAEALRLKLTGEEERRLVRRQTENDQAYLLFLKGRFHMNRRTAADQQQAIRYFEQALALDSQYAQAYALLADSYMGLTLMKPLPPKEGWSKARTAVVRALEIDSALAEAHSALGNLKYIQDWDWAGAEKDP